MRPNIIIIIRIIIIIISAAAAADHGGYHNCAILRQNTQKTTLKLFQIIKCFTFCNNQNRTVSE